ncbi:hypothetical protein [Burkholderia sp. Tr-20390]|uniref:hypothetical protein n=1 Tax=Burkholderia sp. Tr-20390 TaxID=2703904 RepID=UPI001981CCA9|nr:hypothetical protein [Burkholderia sp. Tr-20390]MBN3731723.1 hypothetical protein [Burkholderia sp. Tr-20390]
MDTPFFSNIELRFLDEGALRHQVENIIFSVEGKYEVIEVVSQSEKSIVCFAVDIRTGREVVIKKYLEADGFENEKAGYLLFRGGPISDLIEVLPGDGILILSKVDGSYFYPSEENLERAIHSYAWLHARAISNIRQACASKMDIVVDCCWSELEADSHECQAISVGDVKSEHLLMSGDKFVIVDLETYSFGRSVWFDILSLGRYKNLRRIFLDRLHFIVELYCSYRNIPTECYDFKKIENYLTALQNQEKFHPVFWEGML